MGPRRGGFLVDLVAGSAQVQLPEDIREAFRMAGLSHALAASGFHLTVLLGNVLMLARRWPPGLRLPLAAMALLLFLCLAGAQPLVVRAVLMAYRCSACSLALEYW
ncbi:ComEC/Rec2 family competence protein [Synechococcus sp. WH 8109]|uniref:ComEC/Rec2 family competence protein n=1 Tax=Synechococcus sp. WH 8109 TaxID=166314 RepID=UPI00046D945C|nr:ComEC/Rec2 family competence protein [Synechococcus sp. WH 8109]